MADADVLTPSDTTRVEGATATKKPPVETKPAAPIGATAMVDWDRRVAGDAAMVDKARASVVPPTLTPAPKIERPDDPYQAFGQPAFIVAMLGGLLARNHMTTAIKAGGAALQATEEKNTEAAKRAFDEWKLSSDNGFKMAHYTLEQLNSALKQQETDLRGGQARTTVLLNSMRLDGLREIREKYGEEAYLRAVTHLGQNFELARTSAKDLEKRLEDGQKIATGFTSDDPHEQAKALRLQANRIAEDAAVGKNPQARMQGDAIKLRLDTLAARLEKAADAGDQAAVDAISTEIRGIAEAGTGSLKPPKVSAAAKPQLFLDEDGTPFQVVTKDGKAEVLSMDGKPYTATTFSKPGTSETKHVEQRRDAAEAERRRHNAEIEKIQTNRDMSIEQRAAASLAERTRHDQFMEKIQTEKREDPHPMTPKQNEALDAWKKEHEEAAGDPVRVNAATHTIQTGGVPNEQGLPMAKPARAPTEGSSAEREKAVQDDLKELHPDWSRGRIVTEAHNQIVSGQAEATTKARLAAQLEKPPLTPEAAKMDAEIWLVTGAMPGGGRYGQAALAQIQNEAAKLVHGTGHSVADFLAKRAEYKADTASLRALSVRTDALDAAAKATKREFSEVVIPNIPKTPEPLNMQMLTRWVRSGETQFGDTEVPVYLAALISGLDEYAKVLAGATGAAGSTDASRAQAISIIPLGATTDQIKAIIEKAIFPTIDLKIDTYNQQKQQIVERMGGTPVRERPAATPPVVEQRPANAPADAKKAPNGKWYSPDPARPGKWLEW